MGAGFEIVPSADEALRRIASGARYDVLLVDHRLRGTMNGLDLIAEIKRVHPLPVPTMTLVTGDLDPAIMARAQAAGVPLLHKPLNPARLRALLQATTVP